MFRERTARRLALPAMLCAALLFASPAFGAAGPVAAYGFSEGQGSTTANSAGSSLSGSVSGATWVDGKFGKALRFTGQSTSRVTIADSPLLRFTSAFTLSAWVNPGTSQPAEPTVIFKQNPGDLAYALYGSGAGVGANAFVRIAGNYRSAVAPAAIPANTWSHLATTYDGSTLSMYVNGALVGSASVSGPVDTGSGVLRIGNNSIWSGEGFVGVIDEVRIYDRALSATELLNDMAVPVSGAPPVDTMPPNGTIKINGGAASTNNTSATLTLTAVDASGVTEMRFSSDGATFDAPRPYATSQVWSLAAGEGLKTVYVQFKDTVGNWSNAVSASIVLDTTAPIISGVSAVSATPNSVTVTWTTNEAATSIVDYGTTTAYGKSSTPDATLLLGHSRGLSGLAAGTQYHFRVRSTDAAGNQSVGPDGVFDTPLTGAAAPQLGAHVLLTQDEQLGTSPAVTPAIATQSSGSSLLALSMGWNSNFANPTDSFGNAWIPQGPMHVYAGGEFHTAMWAVPQAIGGSAHKLSMVKAGHPAGEISLGFVEVMNGGSVKTIFNAAPDWNQTPGSITVNGPATLIAVWGGDAWGLSHTALPDNGFTVIDSYLNLGPNSGVQVAIATKQVSEAGTYTVHWTSTPLQNAACYLIAVEAAP
jgi:hypothetical protein